MGENWRICIYIYQLGGGFQIFFLFTPSPWGDESNVTCAYFSDRWVGGEVKKPPTNYTLRPTIIGQRSNPGIGFPTNLWPVITGFPGWVFDAKFLPGIEVSVSGGSRPFQSRHRWEVSEKQPVTWRSHEGNLGMIWRFGSSRCFFSTWMMCKMSALNEFGLKLL